MAQMFIKHIYCHWGPPSTIMSDQGLQFVSDFWEEFCQILGVQLKLSITYHCVIDGQTRIANQHIVNYLQPFVNWYQDNWLELLPLMDYAAATLPSETTQASSFLINCRYEPCTSFKWTPKMETPPMGTRNQHHQAQGITHKMEEIWKGIQDNTMHSQSCQKQVSKHWRPVDFVTACLPLATISPECALSRSWVLSECPAVTEKYSLSKALGTLIEMVVPKRGKFQWL